MDARPSRPRRGAVRSRGGVLFSVGGVIAKGLDLPAGSIAFYRSLFAGLAMLALVPRRHRVFRPAWCRSGSSSAS